MSKVTKRELKSQLDGVQNRFAALVKDLKASGYICESVYAPFAHDALITILDSKEPQLKQLDQSVFDGLDENWRFAAIDSDGTAYIYQSKPRAGSSYFMGSNSSGHVRIGKGYDISNWQNSLIERDTAKELTGSDLCRAMLKRGDKYVMCKTSGTGEAEAMEAEYPDVIQKYDWEFFYTPYKKRYAVPINNQGEPLTASEVGL